jgi:hypothetical protein
MLVALSSVSCNGREPAADVEYQENTDNRQYTANTSTVLLEDETVRFAPLNANERFAYALYNTLSPRGYGMNNLTLYAVRDNNIEDRRELLFWEDVADTDGVQFTSDFRTLFFTARQRFEGAPHLTYAFQPLYMANGSTGEVRRLPTDIRLPWRASKDGRFIAFLQGEWGRQETNIFIFELETGAMTHLVWRANELLPAGWSLFRYGNTFLIQGGGQSFVTTLAELNPETMELRTLLDITDINNRIEPSDKTLYLLSKLIDEENFIGDDVLDILWDPSIRLR